MVFPPITKLKKEVPLRRSLRNKRTLLSILGVAVAVFSIHSFWYEGVVSQEGIPIETTARRLKSRTTLDMLKLMPLTTFQDINDVPRDAVTATDIPFFWAIPKSGTSSMKSILTKCLDLRVASSHGAIDYEVDNDEIRVIDLKTDTKGKRDGKFLNVNFGYLAGIEKAKELNMAESGLVDAAVTSYFRPSAEAFTEEHRARMFAIFRHPVHRLVSDFYYQKIAVWEMTYDETSQTNKTLLEYAQRHNDNFMVRMLANVKTSYVTSSDLHYAKYVLKTKCLILMMDQFDESLDRLLTYMGWSDVDPSHMDESTGNNKCYNAFLHSTPSNTNDHPDIEPGSEEWETIRNMNEYDIILYHYAKSLFKEQKQIIDNIKLSREQEEPDTQAL